LLGAGPTAAMVDVCDRKNRHIVQKNPLETDFLRRTDPSHFKLRGSLKTCCCRGGAELS